MEQRKNSFYFGIDLNDEYAMISFYQQNKGEPETVSTVAGSERYQIPTLLAKRRSIGQWYYGDEARKMAKTSEMICVDKLLHRALNGESIRVQEETYPAQELLLLFIQKILLLPQKLGNQEPFDRLVITVEKLTKENMELFWWIAKELELDREQFMVIDHKESFYYFLLNQPKELWVHEAYLFSYNHGTMFYYNLERNQRTTPQVISIRESERQLIGEDKDGEFLAILQSAFANHIVSVAYLVGDGFDGEWLKNSLNFLCRGRRAFVGKNLFSKGACYAAAVRDQESNWNYVYMGENEMKFNLSLKVRAKGEQRFYDLISAGKNWFEISGECEVILNGSTEINFWKQMPNSREAKIETLELSDLPGRPDRTTRLRITAVPSADDRIEITIKDLGFGEFYRSTEKTWRYTMSI